MLEQGLRQQLPPTAPALTVTVAPPPPPPPMPLGPSVLVVAGSDVPQQYKPPVCTLMQLAPSQSERVPRSALGYQKRKLAMDRAGQRITKQNKLVSISAWSVLHVHNFEIMIILGIFILAAHILWCILI